MGVTRAGSAFLVAVVICALSGPADAAERLRGTILALIPQKQQAIVAHESYGGMPAMTMPFSLAARDIARLREGDRIDATVSNATDPASLSNVRREAARAVPATEPLRSVALLEAGQVVPDTHFVDQSGRPFTFADFRGQIVVLSFIYTRCGDARMCPLISANFHQLQKKLGPGPYHLVEITLDPDFDKPAVLLRYGKQFDFDPSRWSLGTGAKPDLFDFAARFGIAPFPDPAAGIIHAERTVLIDRNGTIVDLIDEAGWNPDNVAARIHSLNHLPSNPIALLDYQLSRAAIALCGNGVAGYSGLLDLTIVLGIFTAGVWTLVRVGRFIFTAKA